MIGIRVLGLRRFREDIAHENALRKSRIGAKLARAAEYVASDAKRNFKGERTRARYMIKGGRRVRRKHPRPVTSPPNMLGVFEGTYRRAITWTLRRSGREIVAEVGPSGIKYPPAHEFGTHGMPKRPVLTPAVEKNRQRVFRLLGAAIRIV
ncbi:MAG: hypothetical protein D6760_13535 [Deltaproteobacteria bacterium]|nr:MAG: hypothetical protein D6760_13535 [Deltaproteobacteria bacterium]